MLLRRVTAARRHSGDSESDARSSTPASVRLQFTTEVSARPRTAVSASVFTGIPADVLVVPQSTSVSGMPSPPRDEPVDPGEATQRVLSEASGQHVGSRRADQFFVAVAAGDVRATSAPI